MFSGISLFPQKDTPRSEPLVVPPKAPVPQASDTPHNQASDTPHNTTPDTFYQFIIDNNLFRPLGWRPPKKQPEYILIGTAVSQNTADSKAFIVERHSKRLHIVKVDDVFSDALVKVIEPKRVILNEAGREIVLHGGRLRFY